MRGTGIQALVAPAVSTTSTFVVTSNDRHLAPLASACDAPLRKPASSTPAPTPCFRNVRRLIESPPGHRQLLRPIWIGPEPNQIPQQDKSVDPMRGSAVSGAARSREGARARAA